MLPPEAVAASLVKSGVEVIASQFLLSALVKTVQFTPLLLEM
jgi:hypothetical protein